MHTQRTAQLRRPGVEAAEVAQRGRGKAMWTTPQRGRFGRAGLQRPVHAHAYGCRAARCNPGWEGPTRSEQSGCQPKSRHVPVDFLLCVLCGTSPCNPACPTGRKLVRRQVIVALGGSLNPLQADTHAWGTRPLREASGQQKHSRPFTTPHPHTFTALPCFPAH